MKPAVPAIDIFDQRYVSRGEVALLVFRREVIRIVAALGAVTKHLKPAVIEIKM